METQNPKRKKASFVDYEVSEAVEVQPIVKEGVEIINTVEEKSDETSLTAAHQEVIIRIGLATRVINGKAFKKFTDAKKKEFYDELVFLSSLNTELFLNLVK